MGRFYLVYATVAPGTRASGITSFVVEQGDEGLTLGPKLPKLGSRCYPTGELFFDDCFVPDDRRIGKEGQGFHGVMNLLLVPMWLLSGAFFPLAGVPTWLLALAWANPMTYGVAAFRRLLQPQVGALADPFPSLTVPLVVTVAFALLAWLLARTLVVRRREA